MNSIIGIDARLIHTSAQGISSYTRNLIKQLSLRDRDSQYLLYTQEQYQDSLPENFQFRPIDMKTRVIWTNLYLPQQLRTDKVNLYHVLANWDIPVLGKFKRIATIHDMIPFRYPELVSFKHRQLTLQSAAFVKSRMDYFICDSEYTRQELIRYYRPAESKSSVIYLAPDQSFQSCWDLGKIKEVLGRYNLEPGYILALGPLEPRKNLVRLVEAYSLMEKKLTGDIPLVITGRDWWNTGGIHRAVESSSASQKIRFTGFIPDEDLPYLYSGAGVFVFPSIVEGFGLPVLEAMACGTPVAASDNTSIPEITGEAAVLFDPYNPKDIAQALTNILTDDNLKKELSRRGIARSSEFSWEKASLDTWKIYQQVLSG